MVVEWQEGEVRDLCMCVNTFFSLVLSRILILTGSWTLTVPFWFPFLSHKTTDGQQHDHEAAAVAAFSLSQTLPQLLSSSPHHHHPLLDCLAPGSALELSGNGLVGLMDASELGWRAEGVLPGWVTLVEGKRGTEALRVVVVDDGSGGGMG